MDLDPLLTAPEAAELVRSTTNTLKYWRHTGTGPAYIKSGRRVLYRTSDVSAWLEAGRHEPISA